MTRLDKVKWSKTNPTGITYDKDNNSRPFRARYYNKETKKTEYVGRFKTREEAETARENHINSKVEVTNETNCCGSCSKS